jgi:hypothetical protein
VNINQFYGVCQVAVTTGLLRPWYVYHKLRVVPGLGNDRALNNLEDAFKNWKTMNWIAPRTAATNQSLVGGQGIFQCRCKGKCNTNSCKCYKNKRICTSACHRNNRCCVNHDQMCSNTENWEEGRIHCLWERGIGIVLPCSVLQIVLNLNHHILFVNHL